MSELQLRRFYVTLSYKNRHRHTCTQLLTTDYRGRGPAQQPCCHTQSRTIGSKEGRTKKRMGHGVKLCVSGARFTDSGQDPYLKCCC